MRSRPWRRVAAVRRPERPSLDPPGNLERDRAARTAREAGALAALQVLVDEHLPELGHPFHALIDLRETAAEEDRDRLDERRLGERGEDHLLADVGERVHGLERLDAVRMVIEPPLQLHHAV